MAVTYSSTGVTIGGTPLSGAFTVGANTYAASPPSYAFVAGPAVASNSGVRVVTNNQIANGVAVAIGIKKPPHGFSHDIELIDGQVASVPIQPLKIIQGSSAIFGRRSSASTDTGWKSAAGIKRQSSLQPNVQLPIGREVVFIAEALAAMQTETGKGHPSSILPEDDAAHMRNPIGHAMYKEAV